jgi:hypothetical protein
VLAPVSVDGAVKGGRDDLTFSWRLKQVPDQVVTFVEEGDEIAQILARTSEAKGTLAFDPAAGPTRNREIVAVVEQNGMPRERIVVAKFTAPATDDPSEASPRRQLTELRRDVARTRLAHEIRTELLTPVRNARKALVNRPPDTVGACTALNQFRLAVERLGASPGKIPAAKATAWIAMAHGVRVALRCA